ncbi:unnamed protein product [Schistocephalus solidus]|uniref:DHC_N2 domain-containing protein n=1 Tax=Schistocephalus solidus TaxID=70667 RepID=A0A183T7K2_SCHSO|nr:unnamed protein product [Schistocephalus solidus]
MNELQEIKSVTEPFEHFTKLWILIPEDEVEIFLTEHPEPTLVEFETKLMELDEIEKDLADTWDIYYVGPLEVHTTGFKSIALKRLREHQTAFMELCTEKLINPMLADTAQLEETERLISRPLGNFDDVAAVMDAINHFHSYEVTMDLTIMRSEVRLTSFH